MIDCGKWDGISNLGVPRLKSIRVGPRSKVVNEEFVMKIKIRTTLVDFLPGLVAPRVGVFVTELGQQTQLCLLLVIYFLVFISS